ncbi:substrate-binding periplasmic protein [Vibrio sp. VB16]|uniref:substrate-binding periplasmic protein n=1 Tax=Vibrio sp. VB16 TaxID=2785746 RepID=UPI00189DA7AE|nr:transporter substrate-binding domain-containing protein [Vibrio sp. VB16]UGA57687.1 transporter substrate-binding domain-containing protein [Vibrio sp. VB16]
MIYRLAFLSFYLLSMSVSAKDALVFYVVNYPPYMIINDKNEISGMDVDVVSAAFKESGQLVDFETLPWKRIMKSMQAGEIAGGLSCSKRKGRESYMLFSEYISETRQAAITLKSMDTSQIKHLDNFKNYSVTTVSSWGTANQLRMNKIDYVNSNDIRSGLVNVLHRGVDILYGPEIPAMHDAKNMGEVDNIKATYLEDVTSNKLHLCISKGYPHSDDILDEFNRGLKIIKQNGTYKDIQAKYF